MERAWSKPGNAKSCHDEHAAGHEEATVTAARTGSNAPQPSIESLVPIIEAEPQMLVIMELNFVTIYRDYEGVDDTLHGAGAPEQMPTGQRLYARPGAARLVAALLREPRCCLVMISCSGPRHCLPMARLLLQRAMPGDEWAVEEVWGQLPSVVCGQRRVWVIDHVESAATSWFVKDMSRVWDRLRACGCGDFNEQNTLMIDHCRSNCSYPQIVIEVPRWAAGRDGPVADEDEIDGMEGIMYYIGFILDKLA